MANKKYKAPNYIPYGTTKKEGGVKWILNKTDKKARFYSTTAVSNAIAINRPLASSYNELCDKLTYGPDERAIVRWYEAAGVPYSEFNPR